jgi:hypothetical protein
MSRFRRPSSSVLAVAATLIFTSCGAGTSPTPIVVPTPEPAPAPTPTPTPVAVAAPSPSPSPCTQGLCEEPTTNTEKAVRLTLRLYTVEDGLGAFVSRPDPENPIPIGWSARIDATAKDLSGRETNGEGNVRWFVDPDYVVEVSGGHTHQRRLKGLQTGDVKVWATLDGVTSNELVLKFRPAE